MNRQEAMEKARSMSKTGAVHVTESESDFITNGKTCHYSMYGVTVDGVSAHGGPSYEKCFEILEAKIEQARKDRVNELREELARAEAAVK